MKTLKAMLTALLAGSLTASAVPAMPGVQHILTQPDGSTVTLRLVGDENLHYYLTIDDRLVIGSEHGYRYGTIDSEGNFELTDIMAHNPHERSVMECEFVNSQDINKVETALLQAKRISTMSRSNNQDGNGKMLSGYPTTGDVKTLVILVDFADKAFVTENAHDYFTRLLNEEGFSDNNAVGSCRDYYLKASSGVFRGQFDVYGPVTLPNNTSYYGKNDAYGNDVNARMMIQHACKGLNDEIDFSEYDLDNDGYVDNVFIFYAGQGENNGGGSECVWPHTSNIGTSMTYRFDGKYVSRYACSSELQQGGIVDGIGTFCHEFGHVLGLPDLYSTKNGVATFTPGTYSLMDRGSYNENSSCPPTLSSYERNALGWMGDNLVEITGPASCTLYPIEESNKAYLINTDNKNEYFLFEYREKSGWDKSLVSSGMLVWHIDYNRAIWAENAANVDENHQHIDLVEAGNRTGTSNLLMRRYPFPGSTNVTSFTYDTAPSFRAWSGYDMKLPITEITEKGGVLTFNVAGGGDDPASVKDITVEGNELNVNINGRNINVNADGNIILVDLAGRTVATSRGSLSTTVQVPGIYIVNACGQSHKVIIN